MQFGGKIKELRLKKGYSIQTLAELAGVSKPAIQQYEDNTITPSNKVLKQIADALSVGVWHFFSSKRREVKLLEFRDGHTLLDEEQEKVIIQEDVKDYFQKYIELVKILREKIMFENPLEDMQINNFADVEKAAKKVRKKWRLGEAPIDDVICLLESKGILIYTIDRPTKSQGVFGYIEDEEGNIPVIIVNTFEDKEVTRKRFTILHELAHIILLFHPSISKEMQEKMCHYFASAMLLVDAILIEHLGKDRTTVSLNELISVKEGYGISVQAIIFRAAAVGLISESTKWKWYNQYKEWKNEDKNFGSYIKSEEKPKRFNNLLSKAIAERRISREKAVELSGIPLDRLDEDFNTEMLDV